MRKILTFLFWNYVLKFRNIWKGNKKSRKKRFYFYCFWLWWHNIFNKRNKYIEEVSWIENFIREFYENKNFPDKIIKNFDEKNTLILTAGFEKLQIPKIKATWLSKIPLKIVYEAKEKPFEMVKYIVQELKFIPREIHIYEDRPDVFLETKARIEKILDTKIKIFLVEMNWNETEPKITEI